MAWSLVFRASKLLGVRKVNDGKTRRRTSVLVLAAFVGLSPVNAFAYIDPGSGSLLLQIVMSAVFGALFLARNLIAKGAATARRWFGGRAEETPPNPPIPPDEPGA